MCAGRFEGLEVAFPGAGAYSYRRLAGHDPNSQVFTRALSSTNGTRYKKQNCCLTQLSHHDSVCWFGLDVPSSRADTDPAYNVALQSLLMDRPGLALLRLQRVLVASLFANEM
jgi:hypothetical protein